MSRTKIAHMMKLGRLRSTLRPLFPRITLVAASLIAPLCVNSCAPLNNDPADFTYVCGSSPDAAFVVKGDRVTVGGGAPCGEGDPNLPPEPRMPSVVCETLVASQPTPSDTELPSEDSLDTARIQAAFDRCKNTGGAVKLVAGDGNSAFISGPLILDSAILWVDKGVTLYQSRNPELFQDTGNCGKVGVNDAGACMEFLTVRGTDPAIYGDGTIDGQGGEPVMGLDISWWEMSESLRSINGSIGNPQLVNLATGTTGFVMYRINLHNASKFHVKITSNPTDGTCDTIGEGYTVWGITLLTPSKLYNTQGRLMTPHFSRNSDGVDPGTTSTATCGLIACNTISTGDDQIAIKGGHLVKNLVIAHNHMGTGHGMSIGSETYGSSRQPDGSVERGVQDVLVYDLTIDADSRSVGHDATDADFNGIRIKTDISRGGLVDNIVYRDICMRDMTNAILISTAYNPLFSGDAFPEYRGVEFENVRHVSCMNTTLPVVTIEGHSDVRKAGPIKLNNVVIDNMGPPSHSSEYADFELGPGDVNFTPEGPGVTVTDNRTGESKPRECVFPTLPVPKHPEGWLR